MSPLIFSSGMSRVPDFTPALRADHSIGIDINEMSPRAMDLLAAELCVSRAHVFVDSGAFAAHRAGLRGRPARVDFDEVFARYARLQLAISKADDDGCGDAAHRAHFVMPDVVGDQVESLGYLFEHAEEVRGFHAWFHAIIPLQAGAMPLVEFFDAAAAIIGRTDLTIGIPSNARAASDVELLELLRERPMICGVHILGAAGNKRAEARLEVLALAGLEGDEISLDANRLRTHWNKHTPNRSEARERLLAGLPPRNATTTEIRP